MVPEVERRLQMAATTTANAPEAIAGGSGCDEAADAQPGDPRIVRDDDLETIAAGVIHQGIGGRGGWIGPVT